MSDFIQNDIPAPKTGELETWMTEQLKKHGPTLLAFADDGVIWGCLQDGKLATSHGIDPAISPELREETLLQAFVFGVKDEVRLFRDEQNKWKALRIVDGNDPEQVLVESQVLWGSRAHKPQDGFTRIFDARQMGLDHIVPLKVESSRLDLDESGQECVRLEIHHLVEYDEETGEARIALSRLAGLAVGKKEQEA
jgi:CRISPR-associated protein (TIGR03984 family)